MDRSLIVDVIAPHLQHAANAWASRMFGIGGELELHRPFARTWAHEHYTSRPRVLGRRTGSRLPHRRIPRRRAAQGESGAASAPMSANLSTPQVLTFFTSFFLCGSHAITVFCVRERVLISREDTSSPNGGSNSTLKALGDIWTTLRTLPRPIQQVLNVQVRSSAFVLEPQLTS